MEHQGHPQGFEQNQVEHLASKQKDKQRQTALYFKIPEAKPLLSKVHIDHRKPKILLRGLKIDLFYPELLQGPLIPTQINYQKQGRHEGLNGESSLWKRFIVSGMYKCHYMKYHNNKLEESERKGKRLRAEFLRHNFSNQWLIATHVVDMAFLSETTSIMARNLTQSTFQQQHQRLSQLQQDIVFDSAYENGNLMYAFSRTDKQQPRQFMLILQNDINTKGYANWFSFKVYSANPGPLKFHLVNLQKIFSFFSQGMKPVVYSLREGKGWKMEGHNIGYYRGDLLKAESSTERYNSLSFTIDQKHPNDLLIIAAAYPYTYSHLMVFLAQLQVKVKARTNIYYRRGSLAKSISGNDCPLITITAKRDRKEEPGRKKIAVVIARQHPSEVVSSWVAEGVLNSLIEAKQQSQDLLKKYIFKIVPMVNIDGVIYGNSRCDISGSDCNRKWSRQTNPTLFPIISAIRSLVNQFLSQGYEVEYFLDLHGHSRKLGSFMYCCKSTDEVQSRIFSWLMSKITDKFAYEECRYGLSNFRRQTARGYFGMLLPNRKAITLQTSFFGYKTPTGFKQFTPGALKELGDSLMMTVHTDTFRVNGLVNWATVRNEIKQEMLKKKYQEQQESQGSDSDPQGDQLSPTEKAATFLNPTVASKIGLVDVKVIQKRQHYRSSLKSNSLSPQQKRQEENRNVLTSMESAGMNSLMSQTLTKAESTQDLKRGIMGLKQTKSVTKIQPFKFKSLQRRSPGKRIRIAIDVQRLQSKQPRHSAPVLPAVRVRNRSQFWHDLQQEYQALITQKKTLLNDAKNNVQVKKK